MRATHREAEEPSERMRNRSTDRVTVERRTARFRRGIGVDKAAVGNAALEVLHRTRSETLQVAEAESFVDVSSRHCGELPQQRTRA